MNNHILPTRRSITLGAIFVAALMTSSQGQAQDIKLGYVGDLSATAAAALSQASVEGIRAAIEDINNAGGVLGRKLTLVVRDDLAQPAKSIQNFSELIDNEKVVALLGPANSGNAMAAKRIPNEKKVPAMMVVAEGTDVTKPLSPEAENYFFRVTMYDRAQAAALTAYAEKSGAKKVGILTESTGYGEGGLRDILPLAKSHNLNIVATDKFAAADTDMTSQLTKMQAAGVDAILVWTQGTPLGLLVRSMEKLNYFPTLLTSGGLNTPTYFDAAGAKLAGKGIATRYLIDPETDAQKALLKRVESKIPGNASFIWTLQAYDGVQLLAAGIKQAGSTDGSAIREALENLKSPVKGAIKTFTSPYSKDNHEAIQPSDIRFTSWVDGKLTFREDAVTKSLTPSDMNR